MRSLVFSCVRDVGVVLAQVQPNAQLLLHILLQLHAFHVDVHARPLSGSSTHLELFFPQ